MLNILDTNADDTSYGDKHDEAQPGEEEEQKEDGDGLTPKSEFRVKVLQAKDQSAWETLGVGCVDYSIVQKVQGPSSERS